MEQCQKIRVVGAAGFDYDRIFNRLAKFGPGISGIATQWLSGVVATLFATRFATVVGGAS